MNINESGTILGLKISRTVGYEPTTVTKYGRLKTVYGWKAEKMARFSHLIVVAVDRKTHRHTGV